MFVRKKKNKSGSISVQVIEKSEGRYVVRKSFGASKTQTVIENLHQKAQDWIIQYGGQQIIDFNDSSEELADYVFGNIDKLLHNGIQLLLNGIYDSIGFNQIEDEILRQLAIARISQPLSKSATVDYLTRYFGEEVKLHNVYRHLDKLNSSQQEHIQRISVEHTQKILGGTIGIVFYDVTTLYFETSLVDELRTPGFSKDGKTAESQIVLGLLVSKDGYPLSYSIFNGAQYEGRTMIPVIDDFISRYSLKDFVIVADSGLLNNKNIELLQSAGYKYIVGAKIRNESERIKQWIMSLPKADEVYHEIIRNDNTRLIVGYSSKRASKNRRNREKGLERLQKAYQSGRITKENINRRGYNKFLSISKDVKVEISTDKVVEDELWDGLKGYVTNTDLTAHQVVEQYHGLWTIEKAFRISKNNLEMRPMFHFTPKRIEAHICICFVALKVYKELERICKISEISMSVDRVLDIAKTISTMTLKLPNGKTKSQTLFITDLHKKIKPLFPK